MDIRKLIDEFMEGRTSLEEEQLLGEYFRTERNIPEELKPYREMFAYFDRGMTDEDLLGGGESAASPKRSGRMAFMHRWIGVAASVAVLLAAAYYFADGGNGTESPVGMGADTQNTVAQTVTADTITTETDSAQSGGDNRNAAKPQRRTPRKYRYKPAPPEVLMAKGQSATLADSVSMVASRLAEAELMKVEFEQQYMINLIKAANMINSADIAAARDEEEAY